MTADEKTILVWRYHDAPAELRALSEHGGDEDWLAWVPAVLADEYIEWLEGYNAFGVCDTSKHTLPDGSVVYIGAHA